MSSVNSNTYVYIHKEIDHSYPTYNMVYVVSSVAYVSTFNI